MVWWAITHMPESEPDPFGDKTGEKGGVRFWSGPESGVTEQCYLRITSRKEWKRLWRRHCDKWTPRIDFEKQMVVAVFQEQGHNNNGVLPVSLDEDEHRVRLRFNNRGYCTQLPGRGTGSEPPETKVTPYGIFVIPRSSKSLVLEEDARRYHRSPCLFRERARFPGIGPEDAGIAKGSVEISADQVVAQRVGPGWSHSPPQAEVDNLPRLVVGQPLPGQGVGYKQAIGWPNLPSACRRFASAARGLHPGVATFLLLRTDPLRGGDFFHVAAISREGNAFNIRCERWRRAEEAPNARVATLLLLVPLGELKSGSYTAVVSRTAGTWAGQDGELANAEGPLPPYRIAFDVAEAGAPGP